MASVITLSCVDDDDNTCIEPFFLVEYQPGNNIVASALFVGLEDETLNWYVDGELIETVAPGEDRSTSFEAFFEFAGTYVLCLRIESEGCDEVQEMCIDVEIENDFVDVLVGCPEMEFTYTNASSAEYTFTADFPGIDTLEFYGWLINDVDLTGEDEGTENNGDNILNYTFTASGTYEVCISTETSDCPAGVTYCQTIVVNL